MEVGGTPAQALDTADLLGVSMKRKAVFAGHIRMRKPHIS